MKYRVGVVLCVGVVMLGEGGRNVERLGEIGEGKE